MDDYLAKPFKLAQLIDVVAHWLPLPTPAEPVVNPSPAPEVATPAAVEIVNPQALENLHHSSQGNHDALIRRVVNLYLEDTPMRLDQMRTATRRGDVAALRVAAHTMKSTSATVGAERLASLVREIELLARSGTTEGAAPLIARAEDELARVLPVLEQKVVEAR
jgi:HPt (histidine-containing phosphotransfer) domain-containing protein